MDKKIGFIWHRNWIFDRPFSGLCVELSNDDNSIDFEGLRVSDPPKFYWFWLDSAVGPNRSPNTKYNAFRLTEEEIEKLDIERQYHEATIGFSINHTQRRISDKAYGPYPEKLNFEPTDAQKKDMETFPKDKSIRPVFGAILDLSLDKKAFSFTSDEVLNYMPSSGENL